ncbi:MAG TPA: SDR family NAD(P)-dependent oxidoreductase [Oligoflexus sp.]|uniref:SDR family NAD(P)-dependent oxidoreductase n=1 Tax=Oligoflexus sp. TaxID=1971216 RepID=UPI002D23AF31|nr:SDR family NAD(P)-dependent oxidoreductase [Oligoflexus sp.]HYX39001.1 SDR family NAD(P)-dependent oxidoreductase [Oligoflexus sp.]
MEKNTQRPLALITGASSGIGLELAREFYQHGFDLLLAAEDPGIFEAERSFNSELRFVKGLQVDLANFEGVETLVQAMEELQRPVDAAAINAGVGVSGDFSQTDLRSEIELIHLNVVSAVHLAKRLIPGMKARGQGRILFTSSVAASSPGPYLAVYAASKAFLQSFAEAIRFELKDTGVTVTSLQPGATETQFFARAGMQDTKAGSEPKDNARDVARAGFEALMAGRDAVIPGAFKNKVQGTLGRLLPEPVGAGMQAHYNKPGSAANQSIQAKFFNITWSDHMQHNVSNTERMVSIALGSTALARSLFGKKRGVFSRLTQGVSGAGLLYRGLTGHCPLYEKMGKATLPTSCRPPLDFEKSIVIHKSLDEVRSILGENDPVWQNSDSTLFPIQAGDQLWDLRLKESHDAKRTFLYASLNNQESAGIKGGPVRIAALKQALDVELRRLKALLETGEVPTIEGQPHGRRSAIGQTVENFTESVQEKMQRDIPVSTPSMEARL